MSIKVIVKPLIQISTYDPYFFHVKLHYVREKTFAICVAKTEIANAFRKLKRNRNFRNEKRFCSRLTMDHKSCILIGCSHCRKRSACYRNWSPCNLMQTQTNVKFYISMRFFVVFIAQIFAVFSWHYCNRKAVGLRRNVAFNFEAKLSLTVF